MSVTVRSPAPPRGFAAFVEAGRSPGAGLYLRPLGLLSGLDAEQAVEQGRAHWLAGGPLAFAACEIILRDAGRITRTAVTLAELVVWAHSEGEAAFQYVMHRLGLLSSARPAWAGLSWQRPLIMGIVNVTPDSFSDGGRHATPEAAVAHGLSLRGAGADILDVGGESTRPGAQPVDEATECQRVLPVIAALKAQGAVVSVDTRHAGVMAAAAEAGADIINDVAALTGAGSLPAAQASGKAVVLMHMQGMDPRLMQKAPSYDAAPLDVCDALEERIDACVAAGIGRDRIVLDPGIGFGKTVEHNAEVLRELTLLHGLGCPLLIGVSRKSFIGRLADAPDAGGRLPGSLAAGLAAVAQGAQILRVHDVAETRQALTLWRSCAI